MRPVQRTGPTPLDQSYRTVRCLNAPLCTTWDYGARGQTPGLIQPPLWGDISRLTPGQAVLTRRILPVVSIGGYPAAGRFRMSVW